MNRKTKKDSMISRKYTIGQKVIGHRKPSPDVSGILVETYVTINGPYRNPAYRIKCDNDGKLRSYQHITAQ